METRSNHILVGSVVLGLIVAVVLFVVWLSQAAGDQDKKYDIFFKGVEGLAEGSAVTFSGVPVGTTATIKGVGFTGVSQIQLDPPAPNPKAPGPRPEIVCPQDDKSAQCPYGVPVIPTKPGALGELLSSAPELIEKVTSLTQRLTELLSDRNQNSIAAILENVQVVSRNLAARSPEIAATLADARIAIRQTGDAVEQMGRLAATSNDVLDRDARPMLADLRQTVRAAETSMRNLDAVVSDARPGVQAFSKQTIPEVGQLVRDLREMSNALSSVAQKLDQPGAGGGIGGTRLPDYQPGKR